jgi:hypothetical protein
MENPPFSSIIICYSPFLISPAETDISEGSYRNSPYTLPTTTKLKQNKQVNKRKKTHTSNIKCRKSLKKPK